MFAKDIEAAMGDGKDDTRTASLEYPEWDGVELANL